MRSPGPARIVALAAVGLLLFSACATTGGGKKTDDPDMLAGLVLDPEG